MEQLVSVIIPVYKVEQYLNQCIESIVNQTYKNLEIILVDDGSPDQCPVICDEWSKKDTRIKVIHKANGGLSSARNAGLDVCSGDYLMFVDSDDYCALNICEVLLNLAETNQADFTMCGVRLFDEIHPLKQNSQPEQTFVYSGQEVIKQLYQTKIPYLVTAWGKLYKKKLFSSLRYPVGKLHEDEFVLAELLHQTNCFVYVSKGMYFYLQRPSSITKNVTQKNIQNLHEAALQRYEFLNAKYPQNLEKNQILLLSMLRSACIKACNNKLLKDIAWHYYQNYYRTIKKHDKKNWLFYHFNWLYLLLLQIKKFVTKY